jgi:hypothetical protein
MHPRLRSRATVVAAFVLALVVAACGGPADETTDVGGDPTDDATESEDTGDDTTDDEVTDDTADQVSDDGSSDEQADEAADDQADEPAADEAADDAEPTVIEGPPGEDCSGQGNRVELAPAPELPAAVAAQREFLIDAALRCDEQLLYTATEESDQFSAAFDTEVDLIGLLWELEEAGEEPFLRLAQVLATTPALAAGGETYVWPQVTTGRPEDTTDAAWDELTWIDDIEAARSQGDGYLGWRAGISTDGQWRFFVQGD